MNYCGNCIVILALTLVIACLMAPSASAQAVGDALLNRGDSIAVYADSDDFAAMKNARPGQTVRLKVYENFEKFDRKIINRMAPVYASVVKRKKGGAYGSNGNLTIAFDSTHSSAGTKVPLRGVVELKGKGGTMKKVVSIVLFPVGWLIKGNDIDSPQGDYVIKPKPTVTEDTPVQYQR